MRELETCIWVDIGPTGEVKMCPHHNERGKIKAAYEKGKAYSEYEGQKADSEFKTQFCKYCLEGQKIDTANRTLSNYDELVISE